jgi:hypothetical protein
MHGFPPIEDNLITIFKALLFSPDDATLKSFVRKVPIPNETDRDMIQFSSPSLWPVFLNSYLSESLAYCIAP